MKLLEMFLIWSGATVWMVIFVMIGAVLFSGLRANQRGR